MLFNREVIELGRQVIKKWEGICYIGKEVIIMKKRVFETFQKIDGFAIGNLTRIDPYCDGEKVSVLKYRITIEEIEEPQEIIQKRIKELYDKEAVEYRDLKTLKVLGEKYGLELGWKKISPID